MKSNIYNFLVNRKPGIKERYHSYHDGTTGARKILSWLYLLWLNFAYYILQLKWLGNYKPSSSYESKKLSIGIPESQLMKRPSIEELLSELMKYDVISFDIFDTLIFRPFSEPTDLFYIIGEKLGYLDFKRIRIECEVAARNKKYKDSGSYEVNLKEIWQEVEIKTGINAEYGYKTEVETELSLCYPNRYMQQIYERLVSAGKHIVITSDMYLPVRVMQELLEECNYCGYEDLYISCEYQESKYTGTLFAKMIEDQRKNYGPNVKIIHLGDNENSDYTQARRAGINAYLYSNINKNSLLYRSYDISPIIGGAYRGVINNRLYSGISKLNLNQEYGFIYGGLFVVGYCHFIHEYCRQNSVDKLLFLSRDGQILKKAYDLLYPNENTEYVLISRIAAAKWSAKYMKYDYIRKLVRHKIGQKKLFSQILKEMELGELISELDKDDLLTSDNTNTFEDFIDRNWGKIITIYSKETELAGKYYRRIVGDSTNAVVIDIGWAGSGFVALKTLFEKEWNIDCRLTGVVAGTNTVFNSEPDMSETFILDKSLVSYLYSSMDNRDLWKKHNPNRGYNLFFELLTSSPSPSFKGFKVSATGDIEPYYGKAEPNPEGIKDIWDGIITFVADYKKRFKDYPYMFNISGRDAYAPMVLAASNNEKYLKDIYKNFSLTIGVE